MTREDLITEISMRRDIPMEDVEEVLEEEDIILDEELKCCKRKKCIIMSALMVVFLMGATFAVYMLDKKEKIDVEAVIKKYTDKIKAQMERHSSDK